MFPTLVNTKDLERSPFQTLQQQDRAEWEAERMGRRRRVRLIPADACKLIELYCSYILYEFYENYATFTYQCEY